MKNTLLPFIFAGILIYGAVSCRKKTLNDNQNFPPSAPEVNTMEFYGNVDGVLKNSTTFYSGHAIGFGGGISYYMDGTGDGFKWQGTVFSTAVVGQTDSIADSGIILGFDRGDNYFMCHNGTYNYISHDTATHTIILTFEGTFDNPNDPETVQVTNGYMKLIY